LNKLLSESIENKTNNNHLNQHQLGKKPIHQIFDDKRQEERRERKIHEGQTTTTTAQPQQYYRTTTNNETKQV